MQTLGADSERQLCLADHEFGLRESSRLWQASAWSQMLRQFSEEDWLVRQYFLANAINVKPAVLVTKLIGLKNIVHPLRVQDVVRQFNDMRALLFV